ncbi:hypothetical protein ACFORL_11690 [Legionella dresdenensis]|uniref:Uncharacterized protein n=1 Tax=Legionella dresdenensis TaxID=450200 RepID=A0ABV8CHZ1_9GAMM
MASSKFPRLIFNSFKNIPEPTDYPHARTLRTGFWTKIKDAFSVIKGGWESSEAGDDLQMEKQAQPKLWRMGIYDYITLFIPFTLESLIPFSKVLFTPLRYVLSLATVLITLPVTYGVYAMAHKKAEETMADINKLELESELDSQKKMTCQKFRKLHHQDYENMMVNAVKKDGKYDLQFCAPDATPYRARSVDENTLQALRKLNIYQINQRVKAEPAREASFDSEFQGPGDYLGARTGY